MDSSHYFNPLIPERLFKENPDSINSFNDEKGNFENKSLSRSEEKEIFNTDQAVEKGKSK